MKRQLTTLLLWLAGHACLQAQDYETRNAHIRFSASTPLEEVEAENHEVLASFDSRTGALRFEVLIKGFTFPKPMMQRHFNQPNYMDSDRFPKSEFTGRITNLSSVNLSRNGSYPVNAEGELTIRGVTKPVTASGTLEVSNGKLQAHAVFRLRRLDYGVRVPAFTANKVAEEVEITLHAPFEKRAGWP